MKQESPSPEREVLAGAVERVTFHSEESGFCVLRVKARGHRELVTVVGHAASVSAGEWITASGEWVNDRTWGPQFRSRFLKATAPTSTEGIERYLGSGMIRGIGPVYAKKLVRAFRERVFDVIEADPERLREIDGIGPVRAERIHRRLGRAEGGARDHDVPARPRRRHGTRGAHLQDVRCGRGAGDVGEPVSARPRHPRHRVQDRRRHRHAARHRHDAMIRIRAGIAHALTEAMDDGHCGLPAEELLPAAATLLDAPEDLVRTAVEEELAAGNVVADAAGDTPCVFLAGLYGAERGIAGRLHRIATGPPPWPRIDPDKALSWIERRIGITLAESQDAAVRLALSSKVLVVTGGPGVGKTTIVNAILRILAAKGARLLQCAPTGRAARRMTETSGFEARTIHRLLEVDPMSGGFRRDADNPVDCDLLVVDEASMVDVLLMHALLKAVPDHAALLIVGDIDQLPSVGPGQVLADIIGSGAVPVVRLTEVFRQAAKSRIIVNAHRINAGAIPDLDRPEAISDFYFVPADDAESAVPRILELVRSAFPGDSASTRCATSRCSAP